MMSQHHDSRFSFLAAASLVAGDSDTSQGTPIARSYLVARLQTARNALYRRGAWVSLTLTTLTMLMLMGVVSALGQQSLVVGVPTGSFNFVAASQQQTEWCWAASIQMILNYYGVPATQAEVVSRIYGIPVNAPGSDVQITAALNAMGRTVNGRIITIQSSGAPGLPPPAVLVQELSAGHPILIAFASGPNGGHAVVVTAAGFVMTPFGPRITDLVIRDPWPTPFTVATEGREEIAGPQLTTFAQTVRAHWLVSVH